jgi:hypothetical protein
MQSFIFDYYGYNANIENNEFEYEGYKFLLLSVEDDEKDIIKLNDLVNSLNIHFNSDVVFIVKNKYDKYISTSKDNNNICLLTYKIDNQININDFVKMHLSYFNSFSYKINIQQIIDLWDQRIEYIENQCLTNFNFDNEAHLTLYEYTLYSIGLAINSLQYLADMDLDFKRKYSSTLTHRRIKKMDKYELFNPFNLIVDHSSRDLAELYKNDIISLDTLLNICAFYSYSVNEYEYLLARLLFPTFIFDIVEDMENDKSSYDYTSDIYYAIAKSNSQLDKLKSLYNALISKMNIRPINWISNIL